MVSRFPEELAIKVGHLIEFCEEVSQLENWDEDGVILIMILLPDFVELFDSLIVERSLLLPLDVLISLADDGHEELKKDQTHD